MNTCFIYALADPRTNEIKYIGRSKEPNKRINGHYSDKTNQLKTIWLDELSEIGLKPNIVILEKCKYKTASIKESRWIKKYKGNNLLNKMVSFKGRNLFPNQSTTVNLGSEKHMTILIEMSTQREIPVTPAAFLRWLVDEEYKTFKNGK